MNNEVVPRRVKCPHCGAVLAQWQDLCCQPLRDELNQLAQSAGATMEGLVGAFQRWFIQHKVEEDAHAN